MPAKTTTLVLAASVAKRLQRKARENGLSPEEMVWLLLCRWDWIDADMASGKLQRVPACQPALIVPGFLATSKAAADEIRSAIRARAMRSRMRVVVAEEKGG